MNCRTGSRKTKPNPRMTKFSLWLNVQNYPFVCTSSTTMSTFMLVTMSATWSPTTWSTVSGASWIAAKLLSDSLWYCPTQIRFAFHFLSLWSGEGIDICLMTSKSGSKLSQHCWHRLLSLTPKSILIIFTKLKKWYFLFSYRRISINQNCISFYPQNYNIIS